MPADYTPKVTITLEDFVKLKEAVSPVDLVTVTGYYIEKYRRKERFTPADLLVKDPSDTPDQRLLDCLRQVRLGRSVGLQHCDELADRGVVALRGRRCCRDCLDQPHPRCRRPRGDEAQEGGHARFDPLRPGPAGRTAGLFHVAPGFLDREVEGGEKEVLFAVEVVVEGLARDPGTPHNVGDLGRLVALLGAQFGHRIHHATSLVHRDKFSWKLGPSRLHLGSRGWVGSMQ